MDVSADSENLVWSARIYAGSTYQVMAYSACWLRSSICGGRPTGTPLFTRMDAWSGVPSNTSSRKMGLSLIHI